MQTVDAIKQRRSVRAFSDRPVDRKLLDEVIELSFEAPSWSNIQPYRLAVADGDLWKKIAGEMLETATKQQINPEIEWPMKYPSPYKERRQATGYGLYGILGIARDDFEARGTQFMKNYAGFGAPTAIFVFVERRLGEYAVLDVGCWLQTLMLAAQDRGLGTIAQAALAGYPDIVRKHFDVPEHLGLICGVSVGYPEINEAVNSYRPGRVALGEILIPGNR